MQTIGCFQLHTTETETQNLAFFGNKYIGKSDYSFRLHFFLQLNSMLSMLDSNIEHLTSKLVNCMMTAILKLFSLLLLLIILFVIIYLVFC